MANIEEHAEAMGEARRWLEANPDKIPAVETWVLAMQAEARAAPNPWIWLKENAQSKRLGDEAERLGGPQSLLTLIEDDGFGMFPGTNSVLGHVKELVRWRLENDHR